ncbi:hypothetical protein B0F90DRAFT_1813845 [Multifurca ochricompacta]|uniref:Uncharacterized protein n=1 Tax=Multifurca ochricompacta TaxID=376703 RepID=A0AAD4MBV5_9AGAM|nr:hypothetical protein B0F90DRAFT_1813845 [Multifurca ochricompacta]
MVLVLDGLILTHNITSSPQEAVGGDGDGDGDDGESVTPYNEPLDYSQIELMRKRVLELELIVSNTSSPSREKELLEMVIRLTSGLHIPDVTQLYTQAKTIQQLCRQRDFIMNQVEEERARQEAERHNFDRLTEALISRRSHPTHSTTTTPTTTTTYREEELERQVATLDADNKALRQKLSEYHIRVQSVEAELAQLRPVLLMRPYALTHSFPPSHDLYLHSSTHRNDGTKRVKRRKQGDPDQDATEEELDNSAAASATPRPKPRGDYYRRRDTDQFVDNLRHRRRVQKKSGATLADARAEHVLLAARKVGRERAWILARSGPIGGRDKDKDIKNDNEQSTATPKTPRKHQTVPVGNGSTTSVIYLNSPIPPTADTASMEHVSSDFSPAQTPLISRKSTRNQVTRERITRNNPLNPLDSLLTAASTISMIEGDEDEVEVGDGDGDVDVVESNTKLFSKAPIRRMPPVGVDSPAPPKRRRLASNRPARSLASSMAASDAKGATGGSGRARSGLDVLADQAAVFSSQDHDSPSGKDKGKGKGKAKAAVLGSTGTGMGGGKRTPAAGESGRQKTHPQNQAPQHKTSSPSSSTVPVTVTTSEAERKLSLPKSPPSRVPSPASVHSPCSDTPQGTVTVPPKGGQNISLAGSPRTNSSAVKGAT